MLFEACAQPLGLQAPLLRTAGWPCRDALFGTMGGLTNQSSETLSGVFAVALAGAKAMGLDRHHPVAAGPPPCQLKQASANVLGERWRASGIEAQLDRRRYFVDILSARSRCANKALGKLGLGDADNWSDLKHA